MAEGRAAPRRDPRFAHFVPIPPKPAQSRTGQLAVLERRRRPRQLLELMGHRLG